MAFGALNFRNFMLLESTYGTLIALLLAFVPTQLARNFSGSGPQDPFATLMMSQHAVPILTVSGFFCLAATVKDLKIQRDMCCVTATSYACILAKRVLIDIPTFGMRDLLVSTVVDILLGLVPLIWLFRGRFKGAPHTAAPKGAFRTLCLAQSTLWFLYGAALAIFGVSNGAYMSDQPNLRVTPHSRAWLVGLAAVYAVMLSGMLCVLSGTTSDKLRRQLLHVFAIHYVATLAWRFVRHFGVPSASARIPIEQSGYEDKGMAYYLAVDTFTCLPMLAAFVWIVVMGKPSTAAATKRAE